jgi:hypothetical protein
MDERKLEVICRLDKPFFDELKRPRPDDKKAAIAAARIVPRTLSDPIEARGWIAVRLGPT